MAFAAPVRAVLASFLGLLTSLPPGAVCAIPSDGSTLFTDRGVSPLAGETRAAASAQPDLFTGAAVTAIALELPPGTGGLTPSLALRYSSAGRGKSWVGTGWMLSLPAIVRSLERGVPRYDDGIDVFELEGEKLVPESDTPVLPRRHHARRERFERVVHETDGSWTVTAPDGTKRRFGLSSESRIEAPGSGFVFAWLLAEEEDVHGNAVVFRYDRTDAGTAYPSEVRYTMRRSQAGELTSLDSDPSRDRLVRFVLEPRPDVSTSHATGFERVLAHRLRAVNVTIGNERLRCWELSYVQSPDSADSLLVSVSLFGNDAACDGTGAPSPPFVTRMSYRTNAGADPPLTGWDGPVPFAWPAGLSLVDANGEDRGVRLADVDGDGRPDLVKAYAVPATGQSVDGFARSSDSGIHRNTGEGFETAASSSLALPEIAGQIGAMTTSFARDQAGHGVATGLAALDLDGDGRTDLAGGVRWLDYATGSTATYGIGGLHHGTGLGFEAVGDYGELLDDDRWALARYGLIDFSWSWNGSGWYGSFASGALAGPARFADLTGDGLPELIVRSTEIHTRWSGIAPPFHPGSRSCTFSLSSYHFLNEGGLRFLRGATSDFPVTSDLCGTSASLRLSAAFQPCDPFEPSCQRRLIHDEARAQRYLGDGSYAHWYVHWELGNEEIDLDSDGLADAVSAAYDVVLGSESLAASINAGGGAFLDAPAWRLPVHLYEIDATFARDLGVRLADVNGDGRVDVVQAAESAAHRTWLNRGAPGGGSGDGPWMASTAWTLPAALAFASATGQDLGLRLVDLDGDGMTDLVRSIGGADEVYRNRGRIPDLLETLTTPLGARTSWSYTPSTAFDHTGNLAAPFEPRVSDGLPHLPQVLPLVTAIEVVAGAEGPSLTTFAYEGGVFDATTRELRGFRRVTATRTDGRSTVTHFHQDEARTGLVERVDVFSPGAEGRRLRSLELGYTADGDGPPFVNLLERRIETDYDDPASPRRIASTFRYDEFGNVTERIDYGEVSAGADGAIIDLVAGDTRATEVAYAPASGDPEPYLVNRVRRQRVRQGLPGTGAVLRETVYFYDGDTTASAPPTRGLVTRRIDVRSPGTSEGPATTYGYDAYGNLVWVRDPRANAGQGGGTTLYGVDPRWHAFRTSVTNALGHVTALSTSTPAGCAAYPAGAGIVQQERGPSVAAGEVGLRRCLDAFGRVVRERAPLDLAESRWVYDDTSGASRIERYDRTSEGERASVSWLDGLGRPVATRTSGPEERAVVTARSYDALGRLASETAPHFDADSAPVTQTDYDVLDRPVRIALPGTGRVSTVAHGRARISITDASGTTRTRVFDPFGNVVEVAEGSEVTTYAWDALDHLLEVRDAAGNRMLVEYDTLGRRTSLSDPDTGVTHFGAYDDDGNLLSRSDALGTTTWTYDALGRPLSRSAGASVVTFTYDTATRGTGLLASRSDDAGTLRIWSYDALGRVTADSQDVAGTTLFFATSFDPLGAVASRTYPGGRSLAFDRDGAGYLTAIRTTGISAASVATDIAWDARGRLAAWTGANGVESRSAFEPETGRLSAVSVRQGSTVLEDLSYGFDASDRVVSIEDRRSGGLANRSFVHDAQGRLIEASGPYGAGLAPATLHYAYDIAGNLVCKDATSASGCAGGVAMVYPATTGSHPAHAPATVGGLAATYDAIGDLTALGTRSYAYDALGRLTSVADAGVMRSANLYDALGRRAEWIDRSGSRPVTQRFVRPDFTWDATRGLGRIEVELAGRPIATLVGAFDPQTASSTPLAVGPPRTRGVIVLTATLPPLLGATALLGWLAVLRRRRVSWGRPALAGVTALAFHLFAIRPALSLPDGDLNGDGSLDAADVLVAGRIATGERSASATDLDHGDVAPLESAPQTPSRVDAGDLVLLWRAIRGEDVDGDGLDTAAELGGGASPFRADTDRDGLADGAERALGTAPSLEDSDGDGLGDGAEVAAGSDPLTRDTDGDGVDDAVDPAP
ncbi:MAG: VCBS repeat-containing protein, partial [Deltaproteobacteria bacterium]|nr:VCBS repeat-containing protein [Deltaproteobacteria bacterium]